MKKTILALTLALSLVLSFAALTVAAEEPIAICQYDEHSAPAYKGTGLIAKATGSVLGESGTSVYAKPFAAQGGFDATVASGQTGTRRSKLYSLSSTVPAGTYTVDIYLYDRAGMLKVEGNNFGLMLTLHGAEVTDDTLDYAWNEESLTAFVGMIEHTAGTPEQDPSRGELVTDYFNYNDGNKVTFTKTEETKPGTNGTTWIKYTAEVTLTTPVAKTAFWLYQFDAGYKCVSGADFVFIDGLTITPKAAPETQAPVTQAPATQAPATSDTTVVPPQGDMTAVVALIAVIGTAGVVFAAKKKH
ncbi:MAG: hypothetical protein E7618_00670 [Ruminococcaceae bacterium]|nr:hypothetical protein [Oscillospiraceae bacterium]